MEREKVSFDDLMSELQIEKKIFSNLDNVEAKKQTQEKINVLEQKIGQYILSNNDIVAKITGRMDKLEESVNLKIESVDENLRKVNHILNILPEKIEFLKNSIAVDSKNINENFQILNNKIIHQEKTTEELFENYFSKKKSNFFAENDINGLLKFILFGLPIMIISLITIFILVR